MKRFLKTLKRILLWMLVLHLVYVLFVWIFNPPITLTQVGSLLQGHGLRRDYVSLSSISPNARLAVIASEDQLFPTHHGFDMERIKQAMAYNEKHENKVRGGSTISQQVAKNVFLWQGRSYLRKGLEAYFTLLIETLYSKRRILELYLNVVETGQGIFGFEAAAQAYFGKPAAKLTAREAAMIAACLPSPKRFTVKPVSRRVAWRTPQILRQMNYMNGAEGLDALLK